MIEIYDEMSYIKNVLAHGFKNESWRTDGKLLAMYYRDTGVKKSEALKKIKEKCELYCTGINGSYNKTTSFKIVNSFVNKVYKKEKDGTYKDQIREIKEVKIHKDIVKWFLDLENNFVISKEESKRLKERRNVTITKNRPLNFNRIKYLFTIYIWTLIKAQYLNKETDRPDIIYLNDNINKKRFKERANLTSSFNLSNERNLLFDLGFIDVNHGLGIIPIFKEQGKFSEILTKPLDNCNESDIMTLSDEDLYFCGYWLLKQRNGSFICENCEKEFAYPTNKSQGKGRKYCKTCAALIKNHKQLKRFCIDCGKEITYNKNSEFLRVEKRSLRCAECRIKYRRRLEKASREKRKKKLAELELEKQQNLKNLENSNNIENMKNINNIMENMDNKAGENC